MMLFSIMTFCAAMSGAMVGTAASIGVLVHGLGFRLVRRTVPPVPPPVPVPLRHRTLEPAE